MSDPYFRSMPPMQGGVEQAPPRPKELDNSHIAWIVAMACSLIAGLLNAFVYGEQTQQAALAGLANQGMRVPQGTELPKTSPVVSLVTVLVMLGVWALFVIKQREGRNWARVTMTVITALFVLGQVINIVVSSTLLAGTQVPIVPQIVSLAELVAAVVALVFAYRPNANAYFAYHRVNRPR